VFPFYALVLVPLILRKQFTDRRYQWLLWWAGLNAFPFLVAITIKVTQAPGYHEHLMAALALLLGLTFAALKPRALGASFGLALAAATLLVTLGGLFRVGPLIPLWPSTKIPYGGLVPNSGMKTAGYWVRQNLPANAKVFIAHDPAVAYWYLGREGVIGGYTGAMPRRGSFLKARNQIAAAVIPDQRDWYPPALFADNGFPGHITVLSEGRAVLDIYTRQPQQVTLDCARYDPLYDATYRTCTEIIPPGAPYVPGKRIGEHNWQTGR
jgi:hypothetical protein